MSLSIMTRTTEQDGDTLVVDGIHAVHLLLRMRGMCNGLRDSISLG